MTTLAISAGQSNDLGFGNDLASLPAHLVLPNPNAYIFNSGGQYWGLLMPGVNTGTPTNPQAWGPEAQFAYEFGLAHPGEILLIVKSAKGGTGLALDSVEIDWNPASTGEMFDLTDGAIDAARAAFQAANGFPAPPVSAVLFMGMETDAMTASKAAAAEANLSDFIAAVRDRWMDDPGGKIVMGRITDSAALPHNFDVRVAQWSVDQADADLLTFKTIGFGVQADTIHYDAAGQVSLGSAFYAAFDGWF